MFKEVCIFYDGQFYHSKNLHSRNFSETSLLYKHLLTEILPSVKMFKSF